MASLDSPPAAFAVPPHVVDDSGLVAVWFTDPPGVVLQLTQPARGTTAIAEWIVGPAYGQIVSRFPDARDLRVVLDMRQMTGRAATARALLIEHAKLIAPRLGTVIILPSIHLGSLYIKVVEATAVMLRAFGIRIQLESNLERALAKLELRVDASPEAARPAAAPPRSNARTGRAQV